MVSFLWKTSQCKCLHKSGQTRYWFILTLHEKTYWLVLITICIKSRPILHWSIFTLWNWKKWSRRRNKSLRSRLVWSQYYGPMKKPKCSKRNWKIWSRNYMCYELGHNNSYNGITWMYWNHIRLILILSEPCWPFWMAFLSRKLRVFLERMYNTWYLW